MLNSIKLLEKPFPIALIGFLKELFMPLKTKEVVDLVGLSPPLEDYKDLDKLLLEN